MIFFPPRCIFMLSWYGKYFSTPHIQTDIISLIETLVCPLVEPFFSPYVCILSGGGHVEVKSGNAVYRSFSFIVVFSATYASSNLCDKASHFDFKFNFNTGSSLIWNDKWNFTHVRFSDCRLVAYSSGRFLTVAVLTPTNIFGWRFHNICPCVHITMSQNSFGRTCNLHLTFSFLAIWNLHNSCVDVGKISSYNSHKCSIFARNNNLRGKFSSLTVIHFILLNAHRTSCVLSPNM